MEPIEEDRDEIIEEEERDQVEISTEGVAKTMLQRHVLFDPSVKNVGRRQPMRPKNPLIPKRSANDVEISATNGGKKPKVVKINWSDQRCVHCGRCVRSCPEKALSWAEKDPEHPTGHRILVQSDEKCTADMSCTRVCPARAIEYEVLEWYE
ncbi:4Fe-4S dicluster domain [Carpediemonas membranifera]|uniref:4Fe-4S dicluster domain n=1 Tax=Carpediemonas membranifera TaxID=201153 RepID=A0A8J6AQ26_9EUKA|nr:4Fe-4S dicluster domain [Carpediemonas membranifera]|eukprot:KAG9390418.1 4Fe-4S dicluster domain [Carpediemonas membranifera]